VEAGSAHAIGKRGESGLQSGFLLLPTDNCPGKKDSLSATRDREKKSKGKERWAAHDYKLRREGERKRENQKRRLSSTRRTYQNKKKGKPTPHPNKRKTHPPQKKTPPTNLQIQHSSTNTRVREQVKEDGEGTKVALANLRRNGPVRRPGVCRQGGASRKQSVARRSKGFRGGVEGGVNFLQGGRELNAGQVSSHSGAAVRKNREGGEVERSEGRVETRTTGTGKGA